MIAALHCPSVYRLQTKKYYGKSSKFTNLKSTRVRNGAQFPGQVLREQLQ